MDTQSGSLATVRMGAERFVSLSIVQPTPTTQPTVTPLPTPTPTPASTPTPTPASTPTPTPTPVLTPTPGPTATPTPLPTATLTPVPGATATPTPTSVLDQHNDNNDAVCSPATRITPPLDGQEFTPSKDNLVAVELFMRTSSNSVPSGTLVDVKIWKGAMGEGSPIASQTVDTGFIASGTEFILHVDFPRVSLIPGDLYVIGPQSPSTDVSWKYGFADTYPGGRLINDLLPLAFDYCFRIYAES